ncbi:HdeD family acid-resistance protein [Aquipuribacter sp. MA13-6]|uniref:HdeD family acid-resistance protein n=1 Tax=unclassified Aquipuribacter TaxID=2635084 RepID=UPI003EE9FC07
MSSLTLEQRRTPWDVVLGLVLVLAGLVVLGNTVVATAFSVAVLGWFTLLTGAVLLVSALFRIGKEGFWSVALGGGLLLVLGIVMLRNPTATALTITLVAGSMFLATGLTRIVVAFSHPQGRVVLLFSGLISVALGVMVLFNLVTATLTLLGVLIGVQAVVEGVTIIALGRLRPVRDASPGTTAGRGEREVSS